MSAKNIFYTSNSHGDIFPKNARSNFSCQIDENEFGYLQSENITAAIKSITFENKFNIIPAEYGKPSMILIQEDNGWKIRYDGLWDKIKNIDINSGKDIYLLNNQNTDCYAEGKNFNLDSFTDVKLICGVKSESSNDIINNFIVHNIYFHETNFKTKKDLLLYLNYVYQNISLDMLDDHIRDKTRLFALDNDDHVLFYSKRRYNLTFFLSKQIRNLLGFLDSDGFHTNIYDNLWGILGDHFLVQHRKFRRYHGRSYHNADLTSFSINEFTNDYINRDFGDDTYYYKIANEPALQFIRASNEINLSDKLPQILGLRTNLTKPDIYKNCTYDTIISFIKVKDTLEGIQIFSDTNPSFFETSLEKIANAKFELIDVNTGKIPNFSIGVPTYIQVQAQNNPRMRKKFNVFLDSSDEVSKNFFPANNPVDFKIKFPERLQFSKQWEISLKTIFIGNDLYNIYQDSCWIKAIIIRKKKLDVDLSGNSYPDVPNQDNVQFDVIDIALEDGKYKSIDVLVAYIQSLMDKKNLKFRIIIRDNHVRIKCLEKSDHLLVEYSLTFSPYLSNILGLDIGLKENVLHFVFKKNVIATFKPNIFLLIPTNFIVLCDIVSESVFGSKSIKILKLLSTNFNPSQEIIHFSFHQDEFVELNIKEFSSIQIQIADTTGNIIKSGKSFPTRCQIQFLKKNM